MNPSCTRCGYGTTEADKYFFNGAAYHGDCLPKKSGKIKITYDAQLLEELRARYMKELKQI